MYFYLPTAVNEQKRLFVIPIVSKTVCVFLQVSARLFLKKGLSFSQYGKKRWCWCYMVEEEVWEVSELQAEPWTVNKDWKGFEGKWLCRGETEL